MKKETNQNNCIVQYNSKEAPTTRFYALFQYIYSFYNERLFESKLKNPMIIVTKKNNVMGHYSFRRWTESNKKERIDELAINPKMFSLFPLMEICQTMVHEMAHQWQFHFGNPSRSGYHNKEFAEKMKSLGLMPSSTGKKGGNETGQNMADYPIPGSIFVRITEQLIDEKVFKNLYYEFREEINLEFGENGEVLNLPEIKEDNSTPIKPTRNRYTCKCNHIIYGKRNLNIFCNDCQNIFETSE